MLRSILLSFALAVVFLPACASSRSSSPPPATDATATITSGFVGGEPSPSPKFEKPMCVVTDSLCTSDDECCSTWCVSGQCEPRPR